VLELKLWLKGHGFTYHQQSLLAVWDQLQKYMAHCRQDLLYTHICWLLTHENGDKHHPNKYFNESKYGEAAACYSKGSRDGWNNQIFLNETSDNYRMRETSRNISDTTQQ